jgi:hypothetical protein
VVREKVAALEGEQQSTGGGLELGPAWGRVAAWIVRWRWLIVSCWAVVLLPPVLGSDQGDWHYFVEGSRLLFSGSPAGGLHLFAGHPELQVGPLSLVLSAAIRVVSAGNGFVSEALLTMASGVVTLLLVERSGARLRGGRAPALAIAMGAPLFLRQWDAVAAIGHLDDALALMFGALAVYGVARRSPVLAGCAVGLAVAAKPWALFFVPLLAALPWGRRRAIGLCAAVTAAAWLPFVLADPRTLRAGAFTIYNWPDSTLRVLGVDSLNTPQWVRPAQLAACLLVGTLAARRGRWYAVPLAVVAMRLLLDGGTYSYYGAGLVLGALLLDACSPDRLIPVATIVVFGAVRGLPLLIADGSERGILRTVLLVACVGAALTANFPHSSFKPVPASGRLEIDPTRTFRFLK